MKIPAKQLVIELEDMSLDLICYHHALSVLGDRRQAGLLKGYCEATLEANPEIAGYDTFLPRGLKVLLPEFISHEKNSVVKRLWD
ncbi:tail protein X [Bartonella krasnovii]|uniref:P2-like prophage tail protein X n=1 Tax=Bartonella krasnovii TaxID=2267275 RepID=A0A5B9D0S8_9HYPH|nr:tail protein X [Bartonella krasnovii]QEE12126.1 P2-like prophage tail protein X [Bartonella krasnovii]UNF42939.1 tail protein X [Bartonella krasnovii]UNF54446.1 tail protein X [Bartonella krasnovii]UNF56148.1 tail protein X [Bartonella krasnovii]